ncbi:hypothetical protein KIS4809_0497 [Bacillus sp. ZZV12-4809]|nr:hypothetical protein KIS4809_0497 [Bacillus sp. ZZV12-4809]
MQLNWNPLNPSNRQSVKLEKALTQMTAKDSNTTLAEKRIKHAASA